MTIDLPSARESVSPRRAGGGDLLKSNMGMNNYCGAKYCISNRVNRSCREWSYSQRYQGDGDELPLKTSAGVK